MRSAILFWGATSILTAPLVTVLVVRITRDLGHQPSILGLLLTAYGVGTVAGSLLMARRATRRHVALAPLGGNLVTGMTLLILAVIDQGPILLGVAVVAGIAKSMVLVTNLTLRTAHSPDDLLGRIGGTARTISLGLQPIGLLVGAALVDLTSGSTTIALMGLAVATVSLLCRSVACVVRQWRTADRVLQAARSIRSWIGSDAISTEIAHAPQASSSRLEASSSAGSAHHGHSKVTI